jgi:hypothetical protein
LLWQTNAVAGKAGVSVFAFSIAGFHRCFVDWGSSLGVEDIGGCYAWNSGEPCLGPYLSIPTWR